MKPIGKTYLIKIKKHDPKKDMINGIYIPDTSCVHDLYYEGTVEAYGSNWSKKELKNLIPIGKTVIFEYKKKCGTKIIIGENIYYIHNADDILAIKEED